MRQAGAPGALVLTLLALQDPRKAAVLALGCLPFLLLLLLLPLLLLPARVRRSSVGRRQDDVGDCRLKLVGGAADQLVVDPHLLNERFAVAAHLRTDLVLALDALCGCDKGCNELEPTRTQTNNTRTGTHVHTYTHTHTHTHTLTHKHTRVRACT